MKRLPLAVEVLALPPLNPIPPGNGIYILVSPLARTVPEVSVLRLASQAALVA